MKKHQEASKPQSKPVGKKKQSKQQKQAPKYGQKTDLTNQSIPTQISQKQMKQAPKTKTLEDLDIQFGEDLEKVFDKLEVIAINFASEEDWNAFVKENDVQISEIVYRHGSHESQEIFFNLEGQKTKGQLLTYHVHGKDTQEEISRQIRVTRRVQK